MTEYENNFKASEEPWQTLGLVPIITRDKVRMCEACGVKGAIKETLLIAMVNSPENEVVLVPRFMWLCEDCKCNHSI